MTAATANSTTQTRERMEEAQVNILVVDDNHENIDMVFPKRSGHKVKLL